MITGHTKIIGMVGNPIAQVKMPSLMNPYFASTGQDIVLIPFEVPPEGLSHYVDTLRNASNMLGSVVTVPHKQAFSRLVDRLTTRAATLGAVNIVRREQDGTLYGDHVDGFGFLNAARSHGFLAVGKTALVVGVGGAGSAIALALCEAGVSRLFLLDIDAHRLSYLRAKLQRDYPNVDLPSACTDITSCELIVNATALGMRETNALPLPVEMIDVISPTALVGDVVTQPIVTPFLEQARRRGCRIQTGVEMSQASMDFLGGFLGVMPAIDPVSTVLAPL